VRPGLERGSPVTEEQLRRAVAALVRNIERVGNLVVVRTDPGQAQGVAVLLDRAQVAEVAGTIAGDDTILIVCRADTSASELEGRWNEVVKA
jgi:transcriptional regulator of arginine metabolism